MRAALLAVMLPVLPCPTVARGALAIFGRVPVAVGAGGAAATHQICRFRVKLHERTV